MEGGEKRASTGVYFPEAKSKRDLNPQQLERYKMFRTSSSEDIPALAERIKTIDAFVGPVTSGEIIMARTELIDDAIVTWILAGEDLQKVKWLELKKK